ncbi:MAG: SPOR domain-containing protein, partial [Alphaproteobacteria bacterium]
VELLAEESAALRDKLVAEGRVYQVQQTAVKETLLEETPVIVPPQEPIYNGMTETATKPVVLEGPKVRLGAFGNPNNATRLQNKLGADVPVQTSTIIKNGRTLTVVEAGPFATKAEAQKALTTLKAKGYKDAFIVK